MKKIPYIIRITAVVCAWSLVNLVAQTPAAPAAAEPSKVTNAPVPAAPTLKIPVNSPAMVFSPGNWIGDTNRGGNVFRQTWNYGAYFRVSWTSSNRLPAARITLDTSFLKPGARPPRIAYKIDGMWQIDVPLANEINIEGITAGRQHDLTVVLHYSDERDRWGSEGTSAINVLRVTGVMVDAGSQPIPATTESKWAMIVGDSITEGVGSTALSGYSYLLGQALRTQGYEYALSACGWSGWINKGNKPPGDVPGYYMITNSVNGEGGQYNDALSRWNKLDGNNHSLLDAQGRLSAYGQTGQEPALIVINYGTNDILHKSNPSDTQASMIQGLAALRRSAPAAQIIVIIPFGQYYAKELKKAVETHKKNHPNDARVAMIDLGEDARQALRSKAGFFGGLHPNDRGHANFAAQIIPQVINIINRDGK